MNNNSVFNYCLFYAFVFFTGIIVFSTTGGVGIALMFGGVVSVVGAFIKIFPLLFGFNVPISLFDVATFQLPTYFGFILAILLGSILILAGKYLLKVTQKYISWIVSLKLKMMK